MRCSKCGVDNRETARFCDGCGTQLQAQCPSCGTLAREGARFCDSCGAALPGSAPQTISPPLEDAISVRAIIGSVAPDIIEGERKTVTALFADVKGSTELMEGLDPEEARAFIDPALKIMVAAVRRYEGYVVQSTGDGIFALFGAPAAYEDHPQRGLYAALQMQEGLREYGLWLANRQQDHRLKPVPLQARIGINTGEVVVRTIEIGGKVEYTPIGHTANLASRLQTVAPAGSIAVSEHTRKLIEGYFELRSLGSMEVRGISEPINVYEVTGVGPLRTHFQLSTRRGLTRFVGREHELAQMKRALELALAGRGQMVAVVAEAGTGKSRLFHEFKATLPAECKLLEAYSVSFGKASAWLPVLELLRDYFGIVDVDDPATRREKVRARLAALASALTDALPYLFGLLGIVESADPLAQMDPQVKRRRTLDAIKRIVLHESLNQPLVVIFEDLHWIDEQTQALLDLLADGIGNARVLLLVNYRPEYRHEWGNKSHYVQLRLNPLVGENAETMLAALLGEGVELRPLKHLIVEKTSGNPFFIEEMVRTLFDERALVRNGIVRVTRSLSQLRLPPTVQGILAARIDRLSAQQKELLQTLAVLGRESPLRLIRKVASTADVPLEAMLVQLQAGEFIYEQPALTDVEYIFKHALTQEVAYNSLLIERRKFLHEHAAEGLEMLFVDCIDDHLADVAYHYNRSGNDAKAVDYLIRAGEQALQRSAFSLAGSYFEDAMARLKDLPASAERDRKELAIHTGLAELTMLTSGYGAAEYERHLRRRHELAERLGDRTQLFYSLVGISVLSAFRLELSKAREIGRQLIALADQALDPAMQLEAHGSLANILWLMGDFLGSREHSEKGFALFARNEQFPSGKEHMRAACLFFASLCTAVLGFPDEGVQRSLEFLTWARERAQPLPLVFALNCVATMFAWRREGGEALKYADALLALTAEHGFTNWHSIAQIGRGQALVLLGRTDEAIAETKSALAAYEATGAAVPGWVYFTLAFVYLAAEQPGEGLIVAAKALQVADQTGDAEAQPDLHRLMGELLLMWDPTATARAEASFRAAVDAARKQYARLPQLRATTSLARLLRDTGRREEARMMLAEIYGWFTEGFDTADLKDAKSLLDELNV